MAYIEREKAKELIKNFGKGAIEDGQYALDSADDIILLASAVDLIPSVDAVEVVRCKDCRHWREDIGWCDINSHFVDDNDAPCSPEDSPNWRMFNANDFCSYGERRVSK